MEPLSKVVSPASDNHGDLEDYTEKGLVMDESTRKKRQKRREKHPGKNMKVWQGVERAGSLGRTGHREPLESEGEPADLSVQPNTNPCSSHRPSPSL